MPLVPPLALMSLTRKNLDHVCPSSPKILGTSLKSGRFYITEGVGASAPCPPTGANALHQNMPWSLVPLFYIHPGYVTEISTFSYSRGGVGASSLCPPSQGAHVSHQKMPWSLVPLLSIHPGYVTEISTFSYSRRGVGQVPFAPPKGAHVTHQKMPWSIVPLFLYILGTSLKSARFHIPEGVWGKCPLPPRAPMSPTRKCLGPLCPSSP